MNIIYVSKTCSTKTFEKLYHESIVKPQQQDQKFHKMFIEGFEANDITVTAISSRPVNRTNLKKIFFKKEKEEVNLIHYHYLSFVNIKVLRQFTLFTSAFIKLFFMFIKKRKDTYVFCDTLNLAVSLAVVLATKLFRVKRVAIVTDLPNELDDKGKLYKQLTTKLIKKYHQFIILSKDMNQHINPKSKPHLLIEGMIYPIKTYQLPKLKGFNLLYAGGLTKTSGLDTLIKAFNRVQLDDVNLIICGQGALESYVLEASLENPRIIYKGSLLNEEVVKLEHEVHLLINPRPSKQSQTQFAFPSKIVEYLASGTPVLSTKLLGIPHSYDPYLIYFTDETVENMANDILKIYHMSSEKRQEIGQKGKQFVTEHKVNQQQIKKVVEWLTM